MSIIGISGKKNSGKDTIGKIIQYLTWKDNLPDEDKKLKQYDFDYVISIGNHIDNISPWQIKKFAGKLKDITCLLLGCTREQLEDESFKNKELPPDWWCYKGRHGSLIPFKGNSQRSDEDLVKLTPRKILQLLGTECGRDILHPNIWVNSLFSDYTSFHHDHVEGGIDYPNWVITDCRFLNEAEAIKQRKGLLIRVESKRCNYDDKHPSETALDDYGGVGNEVRTDRWDKVIFNDGSIKDLIKEVKKFLIKKGIIHETK